MYLFLVNSCTLDLLVLTVRPCSEVDVLPPPLDPLRQYLINPGIHLYTRGPFLERPGNLTGPKSDFEIKISRKVGCVLNSNKIHFVSLANNFTV